MRTLLQIFLCLGCATGIIPTHPAAATPPHRHRAPATFTHETTLFLHLQNAPFPQHAGPNTIVWAPRELNPQEPLNIILFFHGWNGCAAVIAGVTPMTPDTPRCIAGHHRGVSLSLADQLRAAGVNAVLVLPQMEMEQHIESAGILSRPSGFAQYFTELTGALQQRWRLATAPRIQNLILASHSAGYYSILTALQQFENSERQSPLSDIPLNEIWFFDSLYMGKRTVLRWVQNNLNGFRSSTQQKRLVSLYQGNSVATNTRSLARTIERNWPALAPHIFQEHHTPTLLALSEASHPLVFRRVTGSHAQTGQQNFCTVAKGSTLPSLPSQSAQREQPCPVPSTP